ncbi:Nitrate ABC transporter, permease protein MetI-like [Desulfonema limicola]|uniref:Nitrate ABC transporter, permease protein MetI-like n=1 Tax=Desulfonema limicola TaxID=45656 RepID=A0A975BE23_9BACT|nr:ABC transporter permease subunit [Desulfonema limicola]QTA83746.1 Nitrate ABC transporter, permease protein MetI-like [Desulfonema limicola]
MPSIYQYLFRYLKTQEVVSFGKSLFVKIGFGMIGTFIFMVLWSITGYLIFTQPGYEQFTGFLPVPTVKALYGLILDQMFWISIYASLKRVIIGILIAFVLGMPLGLLIGFYNKLKMITYPPIQFLRMISPLAWMPIALLVFAEFESAIYFLIAMATVWPIVLNTAFGVSRVNVQWINMARTQGANNIQLILQIIIPSSIPHILASLRLALGIAWIVLVPAEYLGISSGLGYIINDARDTMEYDRLMGIVIAIGIIGMLLDGSIKFVQNALKQGF